MRRRTEAQQFANEFDCELYALMRKIEDRYDGKWEAVFWKLFEARGRVRSMMHPDDRDATEV